jgi:hypothetical protein
MHGNASKYSREMVHNPMAYFSRPDDVVEHSLLTLQEKRKALDIWEQDARQLITASNEGMPAPKEGLYRDHAPKLGAVIRAKSRLGQKPQHKASH